MFMITKKGYDKLQEELKFLLEVERPRVLELLQNSRVIGEADMLEDADYIFARNEQDNIENRIIYISNLISESKVVSIKDHYDTVEFGATITLLDCDTDEEKTYQVVSSIESNPSQGLISIESPIVRELLGCTVGEFACHNDKEFELIKIL